MDGRNGMAEGGSSPLSFWDLGSPEQGARVVVELYGTAAVAKAKAVRLALDALAAGHDDDYRF